MKGELLEAIGTL